MGTTKESRIIATTGQMLESWAAVTGWVNIEAQQMRLLTSLYIHGELNMLDLPKYTGVERTANSRNVDKARERGLVERQEDDTDRRFKIVRLTRKGRQLLEEAAGKVGLQE